MADGDETEKRDRLGEIGATLLGAIFLAAGLFSLYLVVDGDFRESLPGLVFKGDPFWTSVAGVGALLAVFGMSQERTRHAIGMGLAALL